MAIASLVRRYLDDRHVHFDVIQHRPTMSAMQSAEVCHLPAGQIAKAVLLDTRDDRLLAVLPADHRIHLSDLKAELGENARLADEDEVREVFSDCILGAIPPLGTPYGLKVIVDDSLHNQPDVYFEGGDHMTLIHMDKDEFARLTAGARHGRFSEHWSESWPSMH